MFPGKIPAWRVQSPAPSEAATSAPRSARPIQRPRSRARLARRGGGSFHQRAPDAEPSPNLPDVEIDDVHQSIAAIGVVAEVIEQVACDLPVGFGDEAGEGGIRPEAVAQVGLSVEPELRAVAEPAQVVLELFGQGSDRPRIRGHRRSHHDPHPGLLLVSPPSKSPPPARTAEPSRRAGSSGGSQHAPGGPPAIPGAAPNP